MRWLPTTLALGALALGGCGGSASGGAEGETARLVLDFAPNGVHAGIYTALERDYDGAEGLVLRVRPPSATAGSVRLLQTGRIDLAVLDITDLALARERGAPIVGIMALVQRPLAAVLAQPGVRSPRELEGRRVGVTGLPSDVAVLSSVVSGAGGDPGRVRRVNIGFNAVPALVGRRVAAATAFWNVEGLELRARRRGLREFRVDRYGAPAYPELVLAAAATTVQERPKVVRAAVAALRRGYDETVADPESAVAAMLARNRGLKRAPLLAQLQAVSPAFTSRVPRYGVLDRPRLRAWARWAKRFGIVKRTPDVDAMFAFEIANG